MNDDNAGANANGDAVFYADGLDFSCRACSVCCRYESGYVFLSEEDVVGLAAVKNVTADEFAQMYCRWVLWSDGKCGSVERLSLRERTSDTARSDDCIFWRDGCSVYAARPLQCRTYPFWSEILVSAEAWRGAAKDCPGIGGGARHSRAEIDGVLAQERAQRLITRPPVF
jgi:Fe-S-cluster containining protein